MEDARRELNRDQASKFRSVALLGAGPAGGREHLCQKMTRPIAGSCLRLKRVARYLKMCPVLLYQCWDDGWDLEKVFSDSDWAADRDARQSRSGGVALLAGCTVKSWRN